MTRNEQQMYFDVSSIAKSLEKIANALETNVPTTPKPKDIPGFEGTLEALENLTNMTEARDYYKEKYENTLTPTSENPDPAGYANEASFAFAKAVDEACNKDEYETDGTSVGNGKYEDEYEYDLQGIRVDSDHDIRSTASFYEIEYIEKHGATKKECILDYVTNEFGLHGARYTDIIKFAYYLGAHNAPKYTSADRGYYACAFATRYGGHLIQGGTNQLVKGINKEGKERYFALSEVDNFTDYYKRIA